MQNTDLVLLVPDIDLKKHHTRLEIIRTQLIGTQTHPLGAPQRSLFSYSAF